MARRLSHATDIDVLTIDRNRYWNVDVFGLLRGRYLSPAFAIKVGESAIRNCFKDQLTAIRREGQEYMGNHPCVFTEIGIPYDMDDKYAYKTGDYTSQALAMDANHYALEGSLANGFTLWVYMTANTHELGDQWNGEDLSIFSLDDKTLPLSPPTAASSSSSARAPAFSAKNLSPSSSQTLSPSLASLSLADPSHPSYSTARSNETRSVSPQNLKQTLSTPSIKSSISQASSSPAPGFRAAEAYVRPSPVATVGRVVSYAFDLRTCTFSMTLDAGATDTPDDGPSPTEIFLPEFHFPASSTAVTVSSGRWAISVDDDNDDDDGVEGTDHGAVQRLRWWHANGEQKISVKGVVRRQGMSLGRHEEEVGYYEACRQGGWACGVM
jgi:hypothetical protein